MQAMRTRLGRASACRRRTTGSVGIRPMDDVLVVDAAGEEYDGLDGAGVAVLGGSDVGGLDDDVVDDAGDDDEAETNLKRLTSTSQNLVVRDCEEAEKLSHSRVLGSCENVKGYHADGCTSSGQGCGNKDSTRDEDLEFWRKSKAEYAHLLEQISEFDQILQTVLP
ncbi:hypothetical protein RHSIM_Rhsim11G0051100 [Rhododendron simsii]|uniref:Uncharacterized protein n=1 Tax=Rhododendron simsii TaxID=118357 RepID=A0A834LAU0_RHOSS|nr:hypothetical protein RHSIM_Rhsim11G0051100 [Rhododendron simsii]